MKMKRMSPKQFIMKNIMYIVLAVMCIILAFSSNKFLTATNLLTIIKQISIQSIVAIGMTMIIITGNIDLSVGSIVALASVSCAMFMNAKIPAFLAILFT
ncbi:MAG TPA: hypothetical protein DIW17_03755, partial [Clostridiales bacterium]|nr:hypothetical protein [Clostridiales bacterium]